MAAWIPKKSLGRKEMDKRKRMRNRMDRPEKRGTRVRVKADRMRERRRNNLRKGTAREEMPGRKIVLRKRLPRENVQRRKTAALRKTRERQARRKKEKVKTVIMAKMEKTARMGMTAQRCLPISFCFGLGSWLLRVKGMIAMKNRAEMSACLDGEAVSEPERSAGIFWKS